MKKNLLIIGAGGHVKCCLDIARECGRFEDINFLDDNAVGQVVNDAKVIGKNEDLETFFETYQAVFVAIGNNKFRELMMEKAEALGYEIPTLLSVRSVISPYADINKGSVVFPGSVVEASAKVGKGCIIAANTVVNHDATVENYVLVNSNSIVRPNTVIRKYSKIGCRCVITFGRELMSESEIADGEVI